MLCFVDDAPKSCLQDQKAKILNLDFLWNGSNLEFSISCGQAGAAGWNTQNEIFIGDRTNTNLILRSFETPAPALAPQYFNTLFRTDTPQSVYLIPFLLPQ